MIKNGILPDICTGNFQSGAGNFIPSKADKYLTIPANLEEQMPFPEKAPRKRRRKKSQGE